MSSSPIAVPQLLIETDILAEYLTVRPGSTPLLRIALQHATCYTTMINVLELFRAVRTELERSAVSAMLLIVRVLGFNARYAEPFAATSQSIEDSSKLTLTDREAMIVGMAQTSKLTILTRAYFDRYNQMGVAVMNSLGVVTPQKDSSNGNGASNSALHDSQGTLNSQIRMTDFSTVGAK